MIIDLSIQEKGAKWEKIWIIRPSGNDPALPHTMEAFGVSRWGRGIAYERGNGHSYMGFEFVEDGTVKLCTGEGETLVGAGEAYFLLPGVAHRYVAEKPVRKRFLSLTGPARLDLIGHFGFVPDGRPTVLRDIDSEAILAWFESTEALLDSGKADTINLAAAWYTLLCRLAAVRSVSTTCRHPVVERAITFIERELGSDLSRSAVASAVGSSESHLSRLFVRELGLPVSVWITTRRIEWARSLLRATRLPITEIALRTGFNDPLYFSSAFRRLVGVSPRGYRNSGE